MICHGNGDAPAFDGGCCIKVGGDVCELRWFIDWTTPEGEVFDSTNTSMGTVDDVARAFVGNNPQRRARVAEAVQGTVYICQAAILVVDGDPSLLNDRAAFDAAWAARAEYQSIADGWEAIGRPRNWCMIYGPPEGHCCFREDQTTNDTYRAGLSVTAVSLRSQAQGSS